MATALLQHALAAQPEPLRSLKVVSAGVASRTGEAASPHSVTALKKVGVDLTGHVSRPITQELLNRSLVVLCMTESHRDMIELTADPVPEPTPSFPGVRWPRAATRRFPTPTACRSTPTRRAATRWSPPSLRSSRTFQSFRRNLLSSRA